ncbi:hypothetical protein ASC76_20360 [Rhizobacter sp. Root404]|nr:hypothetical protein ASC76_20360 [Rhizobacter sp. Root404]
MPFDRSHDTICAASVHTRALREGSTLNKQLRLWLTDYAHPIPLRQYEAAMTGLRGKLVVGRKLTRDEMNRR